MYEYLRLAITRVENIKVVLNCAIDENIYYLEELEDLESYKSALIDFMLTTREQMNLLDGAIDGLNEFNKGFVLNGSKNSGNRINPLSDIEFKKQMLKHKY